MENTTGNKDVTENTVLDKMANMTDMEKTVADEIKKNVSPEEVFSEFQRAVARLSKLAEHRSLIEATKGDFEEDEEPCPCPKVVLTIYGEDGIEITSAESEIIDDGSIGGGFVNATFEAIEDLLPVIEYPKFRLLFAECKGKERRQLRDSVKKIESVNLKEFLNSSKITPDMIRRFTLIAKEEQAKAKDEEVTK